MPRFRGNGMGSILYNGMHFVKEIVFFKICLGDISKPEEIFHIIEHFCLGRRRLHLFGTDNSIRPGTRPF